MHALLRSSLGGDRAVVLLSILQVVLSLFALFLLELLVDEFLMILLECECEFCFL